MLYMITEHFRPGQAPAVYRRFRDRGRMMPEEKGSLVLRLKHFNADLAGWEEKDKTIDFPLVSTGDGAMHFEGTSFHARGKDNLTVFLAIQGKDGSVQEETFSYRRVP